MDELRLLIALGFTVAMVTLTVTRSKLFRGFREWVDEVTAKTPSSEPSMWYELVRCPFCLSFWVALASMAAFPNEWARATSTFEERTFMLMATWGLSCLISGSVVRLFDGGAVKGE